MTQRQHLQQIEVCQGPDCFGAGGGATILEIEELVQEQDADNFHVIRGGCRNFCSMGPNVHYCSSIIGIRQQNEHFTKVVGVTECQELVEKTVSSSIQET